MNTISGYGFNAPGLNVFDPGQSGQSGLSHKNQFINSSQSQAMQYERITAASSWQKDITLETAEGDTVTISYQKDTAFLSEKYDALYQKNSIQQSDRGVLQQQQMAYVHSELFAYSREEQFTLEIAGDLNEDEQRDIREALERIDKLMIETMQGGDIFAGAEEAAGIIGLENIAAVEADYRYRSLITIEEVAQANSITNTNYGSDGALDDHLSELLVPMSSNADFVTPMDRLQELIDAMAQIIAEPVSDKKIEPDQFLLPVEQLFADHIERLDEVELDDPQVRLFQDTFRLLGDGLLQKIDNMQPQPRL
jgi:hypothetical protein